MDGDSDETMDGSILVTSATINGWKAMPSFDNGLGVWETAKGGGGGGSLAVCELASLWRYALY